MPVFDARRGRGVRELSVARLDANHAVEVRRQRDRGLPVPVPTSTASPRAGACAASHAYSSGG